MNIVKAEALFEIAKEKNKNKMAEDNKKALILIEKIMPEVEKILMRIAEEGCFSYNLDISLLFKNMGIQLENDTPPLRLYLKEELEKNRYKVDLGYVGYLRISWEYGG